MSIKLSAFCKTIYLKDSPDIPQNVDQSKYNYRNKHPAYKLLETCGWDQFHYRLHNEIESQKDLKTVLDRTEKTHYQLCNYSNDRFKTWNEYTILCRGLIIDQKMKKIVAAPFPKFFNYTQHHKSIQSYISKQFNTKSETDTTDNNEDEERKKNAVHNQNNIFEKVDGSLGICFYCEYLKKWRICTRGHFRSPQAQWATLYISDKNIDKALTKGHTYLFEIVYKKNQIGVDYGTFEGLVLLAAYNDDGYEYQYEYLKLIAAKLQFRVTACHNTEYHNIEELLAAQQVIDKNKEGFVVCLNNGFRVKFKGKEYLNMIRTKNYSSTKEMAKDTKNKIIINGVFDKTDVVKEYEDEFYDEVGAIFDDVYTDLLRKTEGMVHDLVITNHLSKVQLSMCQKTLNNSVQFIAKARKVCDQNLWKSYLGRKSNKKVIGKVVQRITNELLEKKEWRVFITNTKK